MAAAEDAAVVAVDRVEDRLRPLSESVVLPPWLLLPQPSGAWWLRSIDSLILLLLLCLNYSFFELDFGFWGARAARSRGWRYIGTYVLVYG